MPSDTALMPPTNTADPATIDSFPNASTNGFYMNFAPIHGMINFPEPWDGWMPPEPEAGNIESGTS